MLALGPQLKRRYDRGIDAMHLANTPVVSP